MSQPMSDECKHNPRGKDHELCPCNTGRNPIDGRPHCRWCGKIIESLPPRAAPVSQPDKSEGVKVGAFAVADPSPFPVNEKFNFWLDEDGDYMLQSQRETGLQAHADNPESAVYVMRQVLDMAASLVGKIAANPSPVTPTWTDERVVEYGHSRVRDFQECVHLPAMAAAKAREATLHHKLREIERSSREEFLGSVPSQVRLFQLHVALLDRLAALIPETEERSS